MANRVNCLIWILEKLVSGMLDKGKNISDLVSLKKLKQLSITGSWQDSKLK